MDSIYYFIGFIVFWGVLCFIGISLLFGLISEIKFHRKCKKEEKWRNEHGIRLANGGWIDKDLYETYKSQGSQGNIPIHIYHEESK